VLLVVIMLAGEKGIWGTLEPLLKKALFSASAPNGTRHDGVTSG